MKNEKNSHTSEEESVGVAAEAWQIIVVNNQNEKNNWKIKIERTHL